MTNTTEKPSTVDGSSHDASKILLVAEDDRATQHLFRAGLKGLTEYQTIIVGNGAEALSVLKESPVNVLVTDLHMPEVDGFELISIVHERYPHIPVLVMTGLAETSHQNAPMFLGALCILPKPVKLSVLVEEIKKAGDRKPEGLIQGVQLAGLLQLMEWERKSCTVSVQSEEGVGMLYLLDGALAHANFKDMEGLDAVYKILEWTGTHIEFTGVCRVNRTITTSLSEVLLNAAMKKDIKNGAPSI